MPCDNKQHSTGRLLERMFIQMTMSKNFGIRFSSETALLAALYIALILIDYGVNLVAVDRTGLLWWYQLSRTVTRNCGGLSLNIILSGIFANIAPLLAALAVVIVGAAKRYSLASCFKIILAGSFLHAVFYAIDQRYKSIVFLFVFTVIIPLGLGFLLSQMRKSSSLT